MKSCSGWLNPPAGAGRSSAMISSARARPSGVVSHPLDATKNGFADGGQPTWPPEMIWPPLGSTHIRQMESFYPGQVNRFSLVSIFFSTTAVSGRFAHNHIILSGNLARATSSIEIKADGRLVVEFYDFSDEAQTMLGRDVSYLLTVQAEDKDRLLQSLLADPPNDCDCLLPKTWL